MACAEEPPAARGFTLHMTSRPLGEIADDLSRQSGVPIIVHPDVVDRVVTVSISETDLHKALTELCGQSLCAWDFAYVLMPATGEAPKTPPGWQQPASVPFNLTGGTMSLAAFADKITMASAALVTTLPDAGSRQVTVTGGTALTAAQALSQLGGDLRAAQGFFIVGLDRASMFAHYAVLPQADREAAVRTAIAQLNAIDGKTIDRVLRREQREFRKRDDKDRQQTIRRVAEEMTAGIEVLNGLSQGVRTEVREGLRPYFDVGIKVYQSLPIQEQLEYTPIIESMGKLKR